MTSPKNILVVGATGKQGGAVVNALLDSPDLSSFHILAVTRNPDSPSAKALAAKSSSIELVKGDPDDVPAMFENAGKDVWGVFSVTVPNMKKDGKEVEERHGKAIVDAAVAKGVKQFVYTSVDRHGSRSDDDPTYVPHFMSKHEVEVYLKAQAHSSSMNYTILRPVAFLDNLEPGFFGKMMATCVQQMGSTSLQMVSVKDIGIIAAKAFTNPNEFKDRAISLAGDDLTYEQANETYQKIYNKPLPTTFGFVASGLKWMLGDVGLMLKWFKEVQYGADIEECRKINPGMQNFEKWLKESSSHTA